MSEPKQLLVQFRTKTFPLTTPDTPFSVPTDLARYGLSELVNHLLGLDPPTPFDFLVSGKRLLRSSLADLLQSEWAQEEGLTEENTVVLEYFEALRPPSNDWNVHEDEWVGAVCGSIPGVVVSGSYDECVRVYNDEGALVLQTGEVGGPICDLQLCHGLQGTVLAVASKEPCFRTYSLGGLGLEEGKSSGKRKKKGGGASSSSGQGSSNLSWTPHSVFQGHSDSVECVASHPQQPRIVSGSWDGTVGLWKIEDEDAGLREEREQQQEEESEGSGSRKKKRTKKMAASSSGSPGINTSMDTLKGHTQVVSGVHWQDDMRIASCSWDQRIICYDAYQGDIARDMKSDTAIFHITSVPGHPHLLLTSHQDPVIRLWDDRTEEGSVVSVRFQGHTEWVCRSLFCPSSQHNFVSASYDRSVRFWDTRSTKPVYTLTSCHKERVLSLDWHGTHSVVSGGADKYVRVHSTTGAGLSTPSVAPSTRR